YQQQLASQPNPEQFNMEMMMAEAQRKDRELELRERELQWKAQQAHQAALWEHEQKMGSNYARVQEAQAQVIKARSEVEAEHVKLAAKDRQLAMKLQADGAAKQNAMDAQVFMESMRQNRAAVEAQIESEKSEKEHLLKLQELAIKAEQARRGRS